ncbi:MAG: hypothetical protein Tsb0020_55290 [Haliangiales bacterium]
MRADHRPLMTTPTSTSLSVLLSVLFGALLSGLAVMALALPQQAFAQRAPAGDEAAGDEGVGDQAAGDEPQSDDSDEREDAAEPAEPMTPQQVKRAILLKHRDAMAQYDQFAFERARALLDEAIVLAAEHFLDSDAFLARIYADLAVVLLSGLGERDAALDALTRAIEIDPSVEIRPVYASDEITALLAAVRERIAARDGGGDDSDGPEPCDQLVGIEHQLVMGAARGADIDITARVSPGLGAAEVRLYYRSGFRDGSAAEYRSAAMELGEGCQYRGRIPGGQGLAGQLIHYYIAARSSSQRVLFEHGNAATPHLIEIEAVEVRDDGDPESPFAKPAAPLAATEFARVLARFGVGASGGYVSGATEVLETDIDCCLAPEPLHLTLEVSYRLTPATSLGFGLRLGFPLGADVDGAAAVAPAGLVRLRHGLSAAAADAAGRGGGLTVSAALGAGVLRPTVGIETGPGRTEIDTAAVGPLLAGAGVGYALPVGQRWFLAADLELLVGLPIVDGTVFGAQLSADLGAGLRF